MSTAIPSFTMSLPKTASVTAVTVRPHPGCKHRYNYKNGGVEMFSTSLVESEVSVLGTSKVSGGKDNTAKADHRVICSCPEAYSHVLADEVVVKVVGVEGATCLVKNVR